MATRRVLIGCNSVHPALASRALALGLLLSLVRPVSAEAQEKGAATPPQRPKIEAGMDSNDASAYLLTGSRMIDERPEVARAAYWWASRLDPGSPLALYGLSVASILADDALLSIRLRGGAKVEERARMRQIDSMSLRAELLDPFFQRTLERKYIPRVAALYGVTPQDIGISMMKRGELSYAMLSVWEGRYHQAIESYAKVLSRSTVNASAIHGTRGVLFQAVGQPDSALASLRRAIADSKKVEDTALVRFYQPKARYLFQSGWLLEAMEKGADARDAYQQALVEDLSFYPAHQRLALLALAAGDTATALLEFDLAVQTGGHDAVLRVQYAYALAGSRKLAEASEQVQQVIAREPYYADPYLMLARLYEAADMQDLALTNYQSFLERSPQVDPQRGFAHDRVKALGAAKAP